VGDRKLLKIKVIKQTGVVLTGQRMTLLKIPSLALSFGYCLMGSGFLQRVCDCDSNFIGAIGDSGNTRCVRISGSLVVDVLLHIGEWVAPLEGVGLRCYTMAGPGVSPQHCAADAPGAVLDD
jgi:hypothetical protein